MKPYALHEQIIKNLIINWYLVNNKEYNVNLSNRFKDDKERM